VSDTMPHSLAAPIVERPSFSRGPDGRTPYGVASYQKQIEDLKSDTSKNATMAKTATRRIDAAKSYMTAAATFGQIATVRQKESEFRVKQEEARQKEETLNLQKSFKIERQRFEAEWQRRAEEVDKQCKEHERVLAEVHQIATVASEKHIAAEQEGMRFKASSDLLSLQDTEKKLSGAHEFKDASEVATRSFKLKAIEEARFDRSKASYATKPREELAARQIAEMRSLQQKNHSLRVKVTREKEVAYEIFKQKYRNLEADLTHSHAIEFQSTIRPEISPLVQAHKSRSNTSSTFRGTLKYESLVGTKFDCAGVAALPDIPIEETRKLEGL